MPLRHLGIYKAEGQTWDHGWSVAAPVGHAGIPDDWIAGWVPLRGAQAQIRPGNHGAQISGAT